jgi:hypothetical protein
MNRFSPVDDSDSSCDRTDAELCIYNIDPDVVTQKLGVIPTGSQKKGAPRIMPSGVERIGRINSWVLSSEESGVSSKDLRTHLDWLLDKVEPAATQLQELQQITSAKMAIRCAWWSAEDNGGGTTLWPEQMERMAKLNLECDISFAYYGKDKTK